MTDSRIQNIADVIVNYSVALQPGQTLLLQGPALAAPLIKELYRISVRAGAHVVTHVTLPELVKVYFDEANENQLQWMNPVQRMLMEQFDAYISIWGDSNTKEGTNFDPDKRAMAMQAAQPIQEIYLERMSSGELKWCGTLYPTNAYAQDAEMSLEDYEEFVYGACLPDPDDPIGFWRAMERKQDRIVKFLNQVKTIHLVAPDTDLRMVVEGRKWINSCGHLNFPDGEVYTGPVESATSGHIRFTYPAIFLGTEVQDVRLWFEDGRVVKASAAKGERFLHQMLDSDEGARRLGEFAIGTNPGIDRFTGHTLFDEKIHGTVHMALGRSIPTTGGINPSRIHWDIVCDMREDAQIFADDTLIYADGDFVLDFEP